MRRSPLSLGILLALILAAPAFAFDKDGQNVDAHGVISQNLKGKRTSIWPVANRPKRRQAGVADSRLEGSLVCPGLRARQVPPAAALDRYGQVQGLRQRLRLS